MTGLLNYFRKGSSSKCQNFSRSGHSHKIMQSDIYWIFLKKKHNREFNTIIYRYTKSGNLIQILTNVVSVGGSSGILCFLAIT